MNKNDNERCEKCDSTNGHKSYCDGPVCGCGELKHFYCKDCGHTTHFYHITKKGKEILKILMKEREG